MKEISEAKELVKEVMTEDEKCRNSDLWLCLQVWRKQGVRIYINYEDMHKMFVPETISRVRRDIQHNDKILLPTLSAVLIGRKFKEDQIRRYFATKPDILYKWEQDFYNIS